MRAQSFILPAIVLGGLLLILVAGWIQITPASAATPAPAPEQAVFQAQPVQVSAAGCGLPASYPSAVLQWCALIERYALQNNLDPRLVAALITQESQGQPGAFSHSGAVGLMQVMPSDGPSANFMCIAGPCFADRPSTQQLLDPEYNISFGTQFLASLIQQQGSVREALRAYGPADMGYQYADLVLGIFQSHP